MECENFSFVSSVYYRLGLGLGNTNVGGEMKQIVYFLSSAFLILHIFLAS